MIEYSERKEDTVRKNDESLLKSKIKITKKRKTIKGLCETKKKG